MNPVFSSNHRAHSPHSRRSVRRITRATATLIILGAASAALASDRYYVGADGNVWNTTSVWSASNAGPSGASVPINGDNAFLYSTSSKNISFNGNYNPPGLNVLEIDGSSGSTFTLTQSTNTSFNSFTQRIGVNGRGTYNQSAGTNTSAGNIILAFNTGAIANYNLSGTGLINANLETIGDDNATGNFTQSGNSTNNVSGLTIAAFVATSHGNYTLNGGALNATAEAIGSVGIANFNQNGGVNTVSNTMTLGNGAGTATAIYNLNAGSASVANTLTVNPSTSFNLAGGSLTASNNINIPGGSFNYNSGAFNWAAGKTMTVSAGGHADILSGFSYFLPASSTVTVFGVGSRFKVANGSASTLAVNSGAALTASISSSILPDFLFIGTSGSGSVSIGSSSTLNAAGTLAANNNAIGANGNIGSLTVSGTSTASFTGPLLIGDTGGFGTGGTVTVQTGSQLITNVTKIASAGSSSFASGTVNINGNGSSWLSFSSLTVGGAAGTNQGAVNILNTGAFSGGGLITINKSGNISVTNLSIFNVSGAMLINGGFLSVDSTSTLGVNSDILIQNAGTANIASALAVTGNAITVDGAGASLTLSSLLDNSFGFSGQSATLAFKNTSTGTLSGTLGLADASTFNDSMGICNILSGAKVAGGATGVNLAIGTQGLTGQQGLMTVDGVGTSFTQNAATASTINVGATSLSSGGIIVSNGASFTTGTGNTNINATGGISVYSGATYNANGVINNNGDLFVSGASLLSTTQINNQGGTFSATSGALVNAKGLSLTNDSVFYSLNSTVNVGSSGMSIGSAFTFPLATVDGGTLTSAGIAVIYTGNFTFKNGAHGSFPNGIENGAGSVDSSEVATVFVTDPGTVLNVTNFSLCDYASGNGVLTVSNGGSFIDGTPTINTGITAKIGSGGFGPGFTGPSTAAVININSGGSVAYGFLPPLATINFSSGALGFVGDLPVGFGANSPFGSNLSLGPAQSLALSGVTTISPGATLTLNGGSLSTGSLVNNGNFNFNSGTLAFNTAAGTTFTAAGPFGANYNLLTGRTIAVPNGPTTIAADGILYMSGGTLNALGGLTNNGEIQFLANTSQLNGGTITNNKLIDGNGRITNNLLNFPTGEIRAAGAQRLNFTGVSNTNSGKITLLQGGTVEFNNALTNSATGVITGRGTLITGALANGGNLSFSGGLTDVFGPVTNFSGAKVTVTGGGTTTFYDPFVLPAGAGVQVSTNSTVVFLGPVSGAGAFTGPGLKDFEAGSFPASTPASITSITGSTLVGFGTVVNTNLFNEAAVDVEGILHLNTGGALSQTKSLYVAPDAVFDQNDSDLIIDYPAGSLSPLATIRGYLATGRNGGAWNGPGISSLAANTTPFNTTGIAIIENSIPNSPLPFFSTFDGQPVDSTALLLKYTYIGDTNLDGIVNGADLSNFIEGYSTGLTGWENGDFNYDGVVNPADLALLFNAMNHQGAPLTGPAGNGGAVPEPTALALALPALGLISRRRR